MGFILKILHYLFIFILLSIKSYAQKLDNPPPIQYIQFCSSTFQNDFPHGDDLGYTHGFNLNCEILKNKTFTLTLKYDEKLFTQSLISISEYEKSNNISLPQIFQNNISFNASLDNIAQSKTNSSLFLLFGLGISSISNKKNNTVLSPSFHQELLHDVLIGLGLNVKKFNNKTKNIFNLDSELLKVHFAFGKIIPLNKDSRFFEDEDQIMFQFGVQVNTLSSLDYLTPLESYIKLKIDKNLKIYSNNTKLAFTYEPIYFKSIKRKDNEIQRRVFNQYLGLSFTNSKRTKYNFGLTKIKRLDSDLTLGFLDENETITNFSIKFKIK